MSAMYRIAPTIPYMPTLPMIERTSDGAFIPQDPENVDFQAFVAWMDEGNEPEEAAT